MKFYVRRAVVGLVSIPFVAGAWCFIYLAFLLAGGEPTQTISETFDNGLYIGITLAIAFTFAPQISRLLDKVVGDK